MKKPIVKKSTIVKTDKSFNEIIDIIGLKIKKKAQIKKP